MQVTATEFKINFGKYLSMLSEEDIFITKNGKTVARVTNPNVSAVEKLSGLLAGAGFEEIGTKDLREERLSRYASDDRHEHLS